MILFKMFNNFSAWECLTICYNVPLLYDGWFMKILNLDTILWLFFWLCVNKLCNKFNVVLNSPVSTCYVSSLNLITRNKRECFRLTYGIRYQFYMFSYGVAVFTVHTFLYGNTLIFFSLFFSCRLRRRVFKYKQIVLFFLFVWWFLQKKNLFTVELLKILKHGIRSQCCFRIRLQFVVWCINLNDNFFLLAHSNRHCTFLVAFELRHCSLKKLRYLNIGFLWEFTVWIWSVFKYVDSFKNTASTSFLFKYKSLMSLLFALHRCSESTTLQTNG